MVAKIKVAILISGPLRTFDSVWPSNQKLLAQFDFDYHFFVHTWEENLITHKELFNGGTDRFITHKIKPMKISYGAFDLKSSLRKLPKPLKFEIESFDRFKLRVPRIFDLSSEFHVKNCQNSTAMFYGMSRVATMAIESNNDFLYFLRIRPDFLLPKTFKFSNVENIYMHGPGVSILGTRISDQCFSSGFENINSMLAFEPLLTRVRSGGWVNKDLGIRRCGENALYEHWRELKLIDSTVYPRKKGMGRIIRELDHDLRVNFWGFHFKVFHHNLAVLRKKTRSFFARLVYMFKSQGKL